MNSILNGRQSGKTTKGRTLECGSLMPARSGVSRLDIQAMIQQALDEQHAAHQAGECWCVDDDPVPVKRESERRLQFKDR